jgi:O-antigen ligase
MWQVQSIRLIQGREWMQTSILARALTICLVMSALTAVILPHTPVDLVSTLIGYGSDPIIHGCNVPLIVTVLILASLLGMYAIRRRSRAFAAKCKVGIPDALAIFSCIYTLYSITTTEKYGLWFNLIAFVCFYMIVMFADKSDSVRIIRIVALISSIQFVLGIVYYVAGHSSFHTPGFGARVGGSFQDPNAFYSLCIVAFPVILALYSYEKAPQKRIVYLSLSLIAMSALILTFSRAGWIAFGLAAVCLLRLRVFDKYLCLFSRGTLRMVVTLILVILFLCTGLIRTHGTLMGTRNDRSFRGRVEIWKVALNAYKRQPFFGTGLGTFPIVQDRFMSQTLMEFHPQNREAKSLYLNIMVEQGLMGISIYVYLVILISRETCVMLKYMDSSRDLIVGIRAALAAVSVAAIADSPVLQPGRPSATISVLVLLGCLCILPRAERQGEPIG